MNGTVNASTGGIVGINNSNLIVENCYNIGILKSSRNIGGIVGNGIGTLKNCYFLDNLNEWKGNIIENNATAINKNQLENIESINGDFLVDILNKYVQINNKVENIELKKWKQGYIYPIFE